MSATTKPAPLVGKVALRALEAARALGRAAAEGRPNDDKPLPLTPRPTLPSKAPTTAAEAVAQIEVHLGQALDRGLTYAERRAALTEADQLVVTWRAREPTNRELREVRDRVATAAVHCYSGHGGPLPWARRVRELTGDVRELDHFREVHDHFAPTSTLLARAATGVECSKGAILDEPAHDGAEAMLVQGRHEARLLADAFERSAEGATVEARAVAPTVRAMGLRMGAVAEILRRQRLRGASVLLHDHWTDERGQRRTMVYGRPREGGRLLCVDWTPDPKIMAERIADALAQEAGAPADDARVRGAA